MRNLIRTFVLAGLLAAGSFAAQAQQNPYPPGLTARVKAMAAQCQAAGGKPGGNRTLVFAQYDFNGDGRKDWLLDESAFECSGRPGLFSQGAGPALEIFLAQLKGAPVSAWRDNALRYRVSPMYPNRLFITTRSGLCGSASAACELPVLWSSATKRFTLGAASAPSGGGVTPPTTAALAPLPAKAEQLSAAERASIFKAAGFKQKGAKWTRCAEDPSPSHEFGRIELEDLNKDGTPEAWVIETSTFCYGNTEQAFVLLRRTASGWGILLDEVGVGVVKPSKHNGWPDIEIGGPGFGSFPVARFNGTKYVP